MKSFEVLIPGFSQNQYILDNIDNQLILVTNQGASNNKVVLLDPANPYSKNWKTLIPEGQHKLETVSRIGNYLYCNYLKDASSRIDVYSINGTFLYPVELQELALFQDLEEKRQTLLHIILFHLSIRRQQFINIIFTPIKARFIKPPPSISLYIKPR